MGGAAALVANHYLGLSASIPRARAFGQAAIPQ